MAFGQIASREAQKIKVLADGPSGSGKTFSLLKLAFGLAGPNGKVGVLDTEAGRILRYADRFPPFYVEILRGNFHPSEYVKKIREAEESVDVLMIDSLSHEWSGRGGILEMVDTIARKQGGSSGAWKDVTPLHNAFIDAIVQARCHVLATCRTKTEWVYDKEQRNGRSVTVPRKLGTQLDQRDKLEYEFDLWLRMDQEHHAWIEKSVFEMFEVGTDIIVDESHGELLRRWIEGAATVDLDAQREAQERERRLVEEARGQGTRNGPQRPPQGQQDAKPTPAPQRAAPAPVAPEEPPERPDDDDAPAEAGEDDDAFGPEDVTPTPAKPEPSHGDRGEYRQCATCGERLYLDETAEYQGKTFKVAVLVATSVRAFGKPFCAQHYADQNRKRARRGEQIAS